jgi:hypothetical protein
MRNWRRGHGNDFNYDINSGSVNTMTVTTLVQIATVIAALLWLIVVLVDWCTTRGGNDG